MLSGRTIRLGLGLVGVLSCARLLYTGPQGQLNARLCIAAQKGDAAEVAALLDAGANVNGTMPRGALWRATKLGHPPCSMSSDRHCDPPVILAARQGSVPVVRALVEHGADLRGDTGSRALTGALMFRYHALGSVERPPEAQIHRTVAQVIQVLLAGGAGPNALERNGTPVLVEAIESGSAELVRALLAAGADPNISHYGRPLASVARTNRRDDIARLLEQASAKP